MEVGQIINGTHPLLKTIDYKQFKEAPNKKTLIVGASFAYNCDPTIPLYDKDHLVSYCFSLEEGSEAYERSINDFVANCVNDLIKDYRFEFISDITEIILGDINFLYDTNVGTAIATDNKVVYYFNKQFMNYFDNPTALDFKGKQVLKWDDNFSALLKSNNLNIESKQLYNLLTPYCEIDKYFSALCLEWSYELSRPHNLELWERAFDVENYLSTLKIKIDTKFLEEQIEEHSALSSLKELVSDGYMVQHYKGTNKTTGRIFPYGDNFSIQTLPAELKNLVIAEPECLLVEFDYDFFEYSILCQIIGIPVNGDPHKELAIKLFGDAAKRPLAKIVNYGLFYGKNINSIIKELREEQKVSYSEEELILVLSPLTAPIKILSDKLQKEFDENGFIYNYFGRQIFPQKKYACLNNYIQSTAADFLIIKIQKLRELLSQYTLLERIVLQNHDSIVFNLSTKVIEETNIADDILNILESEENSLKAKTDIQYGTTWSCS